MTGLPSWARYDADKDQWTLQVHVQPGVRKNQVVGEHGGCLKLKIAAPAVDNKANKCLVGFVAELWGVAQRQVSLVRGEGSRQKTVAVCGAGSKFPALPGIDNQ
jgi:hypothetical protein